MERIELFDNYINNQLSDAQRAEFDHRLKADEEFASDFRVYLVTVNGICREAHQENLDFGMAMKRLSKDQLREIIGQRKENIPIKTKTLKFKSWIWQAASIAAILVIAFTAVFKIQQKSRYAVYDAIYACADKDMMEVRSGQDSPINIDSLSAKDLQTEIPALVDRYKDAESEQDKADHGYILAMAYLRLHDKDKAQATLESLVNMFKNNPDYAADVKNWEVIINLIK